MIVGIPLERKPGEGRVGATPQLVNRLVQSGHVVLIEHLAGEVAGFADADYVGAGAKVCTQQEVWGEANLLVKVKEPIEEEYGFLRPGLTLFCFLHLAADPKLTEVLVAHEVTAVGFETVQDAAGRLPLLEPMSEIAGRLSGLWGAFLLQRSQGGKGMLPGGIPGVTRARALVLGGGTVGYQAASVLQGLGADVVIAERSIDRLRELEWMLDKPFQGMLSSPASIADRAISSDIVIGAVLVAGFAAPKLISQQVVESMQPGSVICDVAIDQGGCVETAYPTTHDDPVYVHAGVVHQCIANLPAAVPIAATQALANATEPYIALIADVGIDAACERQPGLLPGINVSGGEIRLEGIRTALKKERR